MRFSAAVNGLAVLILALSVGAALWLGSSSSGALLANLLQAAAALLAATTCWRLGLRAEPSARSFWRLFALGSCSWMIGLLLSLVYVGLLQQPVPALAVSDVFFFGFYVFLAAAVFEERDGVGVDWLRLLDMAQVAILLGSIYFYYFLFLASQVRVRREFVDLGAISLWDVLNLAVVALFLFRYVGAPSQQQRRLFGGSLAVLSLYAAGDGLFTYSRFHRDLKSGDWLELVYVLPFLLGAVLASRWSGGQQPLASVEPQRTRLGASLLPLTAPIIVVLVAATLPREVADVSFLILAASFASFGLRLAITQHRQTRTLERLQASEERYRDLYENANDLLISLDAACRVVALNRKAGVATGRRLTSADGVSIAELIAPEDRERAAERFGWILAGEAVPPFEIELLARDGGRIGTEVSARRIMEGAQPGGIEAIARDTSERKQLEAQLLHAQKMEAVGQLAGGIAHDFNNLMSVVLGYGEMLTERLVDEPEALDKVYEIIRAAESAASLTGQLLAFSRKQLLQARVVDVGDIIADAEKLLGRLIGEQIQFHVSTADDLGRVRADPGQIEQVIVNLAVNARDAMPDGGHLTIEATNFEVTEDAARVSPGVAPGSYVVVAVSDSGVGMDEVTQARIFEPFFTTKEPGRGTGLGLATVYGIVRQSGGSIAVQSEPGRGSRFEVYLPRVNEPLTAATVSPLAGRGGGRGREIILLVEDEAPLRRLLEEYLQREGYRVLAARNGERALALVHEREEQVDLVVSDVVLPGLSGPQLVRRLRQSTPDLRAIFISGYAAAGSQHSGIFELGQAVLAKPVRPRELAGTIRAVLDRPP